MKTDTPQHHTLLDELDARQNGVLDQLEELNQRIEILLREFSAQAKQGVVEPIEKAA